MTKTEDSMFDEIIETRSATNGTPEADIKPDAEQEIEEAVADIVKSWREFRAVNSGSPIVQHDYNWWNCLCYLALAEDRLKDAFCGRDRSPASIRQYHRWRLRVIDGRRYRADA